MKSEKEDAFGLAILMVVMATVVAVIGIVMMQNKDRAKLIDKKPAIEKVIKQDAKPCPCKPKAPSIKPLPPNTPKPPACGPVVIAFTAKWCSPCRLAEPELDKAIAAGLDVRTLDFDRNRDLASQYGVKSVPSFLIYRDGVNFTLKTHDVREVVKLLN
jgi:thiol:disulfide interchange protein